MKRLLQGILVGVLLSALVLGAVLLLAGLRITDDPTRAELLMRGAEPGPTRTVPCGHACGGNRALAQTLPLNAPGSPREQAAATVNAFFDAWTAGRGPLACSYLTARGRRLVLTIGPQLHGLSEPIAIESCEQVIRDSAAAVKGPIGEHVSAGQVEIDPGGTAVVQGRVRGALSLRIERGRWLVEVPTFID